MNLDDGPLTLALAMLAGVIAQGAARHARIPGIVILLVLGVALGPDGLNLVRPQLLGEGLAGFVGFSVAIILFEGALTVRLEALRKQARSIQRLVTVGALITGILATASAAAFMAWNWRLAVLFGTLVMVTGPTVVNPLVRRLRLLPHLSEILKAEGIFVDAVGATVAVVALEVVLASTGRAAAGEALTIFLRFGAGAAIGGAAGLLLVGALRVKRLVPAGLENVLALAVAVASFQAANAIVSESGLTAAIVAGLVVGNIPNRRLEQIAEFKEQLTDLLVATLFVLLSADVRLDDILALGWRGIAVVVTLMVLVRPVSVFASTHGSELTRNERWCLAWIAPRGIVAAAVASLFATELAHAGIAGGTELRALVFVVIATTVTLQGLSAGVVAGALGVRLKPKSGVLILGANRLACFVAKILHDRGVRVTLVESREELWAAARADGLEVVQGDGLDIDTLLGADVENARWCVGLTPNEHVNFLFARLVTEELRAPGAMMLLERHEAGITPAMADHHEIGVLFGRETNVLHWLDTARRGELLAERWRLTGGDVAQALAEQPLDDVLAVAHVRGGEVTLVSPTLSLKPGDEVVFGVVRSTHRAATAWLASRGWTQITDVGAAATAAPAPAALPAG
ncbi:MAG: cation:proton antiporter [Kofleriaceae bacterium]